MVYKYCLFLRNPNSHYLAHKIPEFSPPRNNSTRTSLQHNFYCFTIVLHAHLRLHTRMMMNIYIYITATGSTPDGSSTVHIYTQHTEYTERNIQTTQ
jgi:hypothetical protein